MRIIHKLRLFLVAAWFGLAVYFSAIVAPTVFRVLRSFGLPNAGEIAGTIVSSTLSVVNITGFVVGLLVLGGLLLVRRNYSGLSVISQSALLVVLAIATGVGEWIIAARMRTLRAAMNGHIDQVPFNDPNHAAFTALHVYSVAALSIAMIAAVVLAFVIAVSHERDLSV